VGAVNHLPAHFDRQAGAGDQRFHFVGIHDPAHRQETNAARRQETLLHHLFEVGEQLGAAGQAVHPGVQARRVLRALAQLARVDAVVGRRLVQAHERIGLVPVPTGPVVTIDHDDLRVAVGQQRIDEGHADGTGADHEVVGFDRRHGHPRDFSWSRAGGTR
jgi:hypothetical protein